MISTAGTVSIESDVVFGSAGDLELKGDIYLPPPALNKRTAVIHVYGGGFERGNRVQASDAAHKFAERGYTSLTVWHRLTHRRRRPLRLHEHEGVAAGLPRPRRGGRPDALRFWRRLGELQSDQDDLRVLLARNGRRA